MTWDISAGGGGTRVEVTAGGVPDGISIADHAVAADPATGPVDPSR